MQNQFTYDVVYEVKNLLTSLRAAVKALELVKDEAQRRQFLGTIQENAVRMERLLNDIGAARRRDGELEQEICTNFDMCQLLRNIAQQYGLVTAQKKISRSKWNWLKTQYHTWPRKAAYAGLRKLGH